jgi:hypothetical protein
VEFKLVFVKVIGAPAQIEPGILKLAVGHCPESEIENRNDERVNIKIRRTSFVNSVCIE